MECRTADDLAIRLPEAVPDRLGDDVEHEKGLRGEILSDGHALCSGTGYIRPHCPQARRLGAGVWVPPHLESRLRHAGPCCAGVIRVQVEE